MPSAVPATPVFESAYRTKSISPSRLFSYLPVAENTMLFVENRIDGAMVHAPERGSRVKWCKGRSGGAPASKSQRELLPSNTSEPKDAVLIVVQKRLLRLRVVRRRPDVGAGADEQNDHRQQGGEVEDRALRLGGGTTRRAYCFRVYAFWVSVCLSTSPNVR